MMMMPMMTTILVSRVQDRGEIICNSERRLASSIDNIILSEEGICVIIMEHDWADGVQEDKVDTTCCT
jgi:hypothetical protein